MLRVKKENVIVCTFGLFQAFVHLVIKLQNKNGSKDSAQPDGNKT